MKKTSSLNHMTEVFFFFLFVIVCANIEDLYEPFLNFAKEGIPHLPPCTAWNSWHSFAE